jgi:hypothetical protein
VGLHVTESKPAALGALYEDLLRARRVVLRSRQVPSRNRLELSNARHDLVVALEAYTHGLDSAGRPVPYALRDELRLQRGLDSPTG